jgi:hypothetical protein
MAKSHDAQGMSTAPALGGSGFKGTGKPGGPGGNKKTPGASGDPKPQARPGGPGGQKTAPSVGGPQAPRPGGQQPSGPDSSKV